ncbi:MAG TPA: hypothetical protein VFW45_16155 [Candidatus Polarisedimenticolia bacterium]|nr:hypothetical protein [Candidatus Polarisedimenticolia bacterium]
MTHRTLDFGGMVGVAASLKKRWFVGFRQKRERGILFGWQAEYTVKESHVKQKMSLCHFSVAQQAFSPISSLLTEIEGPTYNSRPESA